MLGYQSPLQTEVKDAVKITNKVKAIEFDRNSGFQTVVESFIWKIPELGKRLRNEFSFEIRLMNISQFQAILQLWEPVMRLPS